MLKTAFFQGLLLLSTCPLSTDSCSGIREGKLGFATCGMVQGTIALSSLRIWSETQMSGSNYRCKRIDSEILVEVLGKANCYLFIFLCIIHVCLYVSAHTCLYGCTWTCLWRSQFDRKCVFLSFSTPWFGKENRELSLSLELTDSARLTDQHVSRIFLFFFSFFLYKE